MNFNEYQELSKRTMPDHDNAEKRFLAVANYSLGLMGESGELGDLIKKEIFHGHPADLEKVKKEAGDVLHYLAGIATLYGFSLQEAAGMNIEKLKKRYPEGFSTEASMKRVDVK
nr:nucleoside triphosphate pyrophosphohydrolase family protein [Bacillus badius]